MVQINIEGQAEPTVENPKPQLRNVQPAKPDVVGFFDNAVNFNRAINAQIELNLSQTTTSDISALINDNTARNTAQQNNEPVLTIDELNEIFPDVQFKENLPQSVAQNVAKRQRERRELQQIIAQGPDNFLTNTAYFVAGLVPHFMDPTNIIADIAGIGFLKTISSSARVVGGVRNAAKARRALGFSKASTGKQMLAGEITGGILANAAIEPVSFEVAKRDQSERKALDSLIDVTVGAAAFPVASASLRGLAKLRFGFPEVKQAAGDIFAKFRDTGLEAEVATHKTTISQLEQLKKPDTSGLELQHVKAIDSNIDPANTKLDPAIRSRTDKVVLNRNDIPNTRIYSVPKNPGIRGSGVNYHSTSSAIYGDSIKQYTTALSEANAMAAHPLGKTSQIEEVNLQSNNLVNIDRPVPPGMASQILNTFNETIGEKINQIDGSLRDLFSDVRKLIRRGDLPEGSEEVVHQAVRDAGFDGYIERKSVELGRPIKERTVVSVFDEKVSSLEKDIKNYEPDPSQIQNITNQELQQLRDQSLSDRNDLIKVESANSINNYFNENQPVTNIEPETIRTDIETSLDVLRKFDERGTLTPGDKAVLNEVEANLKTIEEFEKIGKEFKDCIRG